MKQCDTAIVAHGYPLQYSVFQSISFFDDPNTGTFLKRGGNGWGAHAASVLVIASCDHDLCFCRDS